MPGGLNICTLRSGPLSTQRSPCLALAGRTCGAEPVLPTGRTKSLAWGGLVPGLGVPSGLGGLVGLVGVRPRAYCIVADNLIGIARARSAPEEVFCPLISPIFKSFRL
jgi:hypothetical protein